MSLQNVLKRDLVCCAANDSIQTVAKVMDQQNIGCVLITENRIPVGIITDRDIVTRCVVDGVDCRQKPVRDIMSSPVTCAGITDGIYDVVRLMKEKEIRRIPVVDQNGNAVGLLSFGDMLQLLQTELDNLAKAASPAKPKLVQQVAA